jgi:glycerol-3-phosphate dehydrogenase
MDVGIIGGGINGLCCAWKLAEHGHKVTVYERDTIMSATSRASTKLLYGGLRYLENGEFRLVREALRERDAWIARAQHIAKPIRLTMPIYKNSRRSRWIISAGLFLYDHIAGRSALPKSKWLAREELLEIHASLNPDGLLGGFEFSEGQMDDYALGLWVADQAKAIGVEIQENTEVVYVTPHATLATSKKTIQHDKLINVAGPWAVNLLERSGIQCTYRLDLVRGSHLVLNQATRHAYLLEVPRERRVFFVLPWKGRTLVGTTEVRQTLDEPVQCSADEKTYLLNAYAHYFPSSTAEIFETFAGLRPLLYSAADPNKATREYAMHHNGKLTTVLGGKWTTALGLAKKVSETIH